MKNRELILAVEFFYRFGSIELADTRAPISNGSRTRVILLVRILEGRLKRDTPTIYDISIEFADRIDQIYTYEFRVSGRVSRVYDSR